jgi:hypothetical protein
MKKHPYYDRESKETSFKIAVWCGIGLVVLLIIIFVGSALNLIELQ